MSAEAGAVTTVEGPLMAGSKFDVRAIVTDHAATLVDARDGSRSPGDRFMHFGLPPILGLMAAAVVRLTGWSIDDLSAIISGVSIFTGFLFGLGMFVFQLRLGVTQDPRLVQSVRVKTRLDELFQNVLYAVLAGLVATVVTVAMSTVTTDNVWWRATCTGLVTVLFSHLIVVLAMCLKRLRGAYRALN